MKQEERKALATLMTIILASLGVCSLIATPVLCQQSAVPAEKAQVITVGTIEGIESALDPALAYGAFDWDIITSLSSGLVDIAPGSDGSTDHIVPALAISWDVSLDGRIWDFQLRQGVTFENGEAFNASIVKYTFDRNCNLTGSGLEEPDGPQVNMGYKTIIENVTVTGEYSVRFFLHAPFAAFLQLMSCAASYMIEPRYAPMNQLVFYVQDDPRASTPCSLGPYLLEKWTRAAGNDQEIRLKENPNYWNASGGYPVTERIIIKIYPSSVSLATAIASGEVDIAYRQFTPSQVDVFRSYSGLRVWEGHGPQIQYMCFQQRIYPFDQVEVRRAIAACLNRTRLCQFVFQGTADPLYSIVPSGVAYHQDSFAKYGEANYTYAKAVLAPLGFNESHKLQVDLWYESSGHYPYSADQAEVYESDLEQSGVITVNLVALDWVSFRLARNAGTMPVFVYGWRMHLIDPDNCADLSFAYWLNLGFNSTYGGAAQYDYWIKGRSALTDIDRYSNYSALQDLQASECSVVPLWQSHNNVVSRISVAGVTPDVTDRLYFWCLEMETATTSTTTTSTTTTSTTTTSTTTTSTTTTDNTTNDTTPGLWNLTSSVVTVVSLIVIVIFGVAIIRSRK